jgi:hypothetical protein
LSGLQPSGNSRVRLGRTPAYQSFKSRPSEPFIHIPESTTPEIITPVLARKETTFNYSTPIRSTQNKLKPTAVVQPQNSYSPNDVLPPPPDIQLVEEPKPTRTSFTPPPPPPHSSLTPPHPPPKDPIKKPLNKNNCHVPLNIPPPPPVKHGFAKPTLFPSSMTSKPVSHNKPPLPQQTVPSGISMTDVLKRRSEILAKKAVQKEVATSKTSPDSQKSGLSSSGFQSSCSGMDKCFFN